jgi:hypothetical protein
VAALNIVVAAPFWRRGSLSIPNKAVESLLLSLSACSAEGAEQIHAKQQRLVRTPAAPIVV